MTCGCIRRASIITDSLVELELASRRSARRPGYDIFLADPVEGSRGGRGESVALVEHCGSVAQGDKVDEDGARGSGAGVRQKAARGIYVNLLNLS